MRGIVMPVVLVAACVAVRAGAQQPPMVSEQSAQQAAVTAAQSFVSAYNAGNAAGIAHLFAKDGVYLTPGGTMLTDPQEIEKAITGRIMAGWTHETVKALNAHPAGDQVWVIGEYAITGSGQNAGKQIGGYYAAVLMPEGSEWRYRMLIGNLKPMQDVTGMATATAK